MDLLFKIKRRVLWILFSFLPKKQDKVVLQSFYGRGYSDSPKAIGDALLEQGGFRIYWVVKGKTEAGTVPPGITPVQIDTASSIYHFCTAGFWVDNCRKWAFVKKRGKQCYIQTWHGFPLKKIEKDAGDALPADYIEAAQKDSAMCDLFLSNSGFLSHIYRNGFWYGGEILEKGFPRNDVLVNGDESLRQKAYGVLRLEKGPNYILYAPTFRRGMDISVYDIDYRRCVKAFEETFGGKWTVLLKLHPNIADKARELPLETGIAENVSDYPDIIDLYLVSKAMISDYSSVMFDYIATGKPCFLYLNDLEAYKDDRDFYFDIEKLPFARAHNNEELEKAIRAFDSSAYSEKLKSFITEFGIAETGTAAAAAVDFIEKKRGQA